MSYETIKVEIADKVAKVILNRPDKKNAMSPQLHRDMTQVLEDLRYDPAAAVLVITGAGNSFCAGMDLKEFFHALKLSRIPPSTTASRGSRSSGAAARCATTPSPPSRW